MVNAGHAPTTVGRTSHGGKHDFTDHISVEGFDDRYEYDVVCLFSELHIRVHLVASLLAQ